MFNPSASAAHLRHYQQQQHQQDQQQQQQQALHQTKSECDYYSSYSLEQQQPQEAHVDKVRH